MIAALIFVVSFLTLLQFFVSYCHSLIAASRQQELSEQAREICGFTSRTAKAGEFRRLLELLALCPESGGSRFEVRAVAIYYRILGLARVLSQPVFPSAASWMEGERGGCSYAAAVALDKRIAYNRMLLIQQSS